LGRLSKRGKDALYVISSRTPLSNSEMLNIAKAIAVHFNYRLLHKAGEEVYYKEDDESVRKNTQNLMNLGIFRAGRLPGDIWRDLMGVLLDSPLSDEESTRLNLQEFK
jgi:hypothetical protein